MITLQIQRAIACLGNPHYKTLDINLGITQLTFLHYHDLNLTAIAVFSAVIFYHTPQYNRI
ncbi:hypothetical protein ACX27_07935 [Nostoc piscinale CENA21]|uniref:Uncharacterized protein n=1 Tax=Nostoc piscinale CENA21 TaxID=224013 RepID=A0A0M4T123_9NOSO|nr:hypothetical protein [Nostoc piscinale]ALF52808.1 hypothetical protein ACX27_07935 [Nostoc piscinale CENA21]